MESKREQERGWRGASSVSQVKPRQLRSILQMSWQASGEATLGVRSKMPAWSQVTPAWRQGQSHLVCLLGVTWRQEGKVSPGLRAEVRGSSRRDSILNRGGELYCEVPRELVFSTGAGMFGKLKTAYR